MAQRPLVVLGNGPSLRTFDLHDLRDDYDTIGMNAAYRYWERVGWYPTYYCCMDPIVQNSHQVAIRRLIAERDTLGIRLFFLRNTLLETAPELEGHPAVIWLEELLHHPLFDTTLVTTGAFSARLGIYLGYRQLYLMGIDLQYVEVLPEAKAGPNHELLLTRTPQHNPNYFFDDYQQAGDRYQIPNPPAAPSVHIASWSTLKQQVHGVAIYNASDQSRFSLFPHVLLGTADAPDTAIPPLHLKRPARVLRHVRMLYRRLQAGHIRLNSDWREPDGPICQEQNDIVPRAASAIYQSTGHLPLDSVYLVGDWEPLQRLEDERWRCLQALGFLMIARPSEGLRWLHLDVAPERAGAAVAIRSEGRHIAAFRVRRRMVLSVLIPVQWGTDTLLALHTSAPVRLYAVTLTT